MELTELVKDKLDYQVQITIKEKDVKQKIESELNKLSTNMKMDGFRKGKVPVSIIQSKFGSSVRLEVIQKEANESINKIIKDKDLKLAKDPQIEDFKMDEGKDISMKVKFSLLPEIKMPDFKKINIEKPVIKLTAAEEKTEIENLCKNLTKYEKISKVKAKLNDQLVIDFVGSVDGKEFDGGKSTDHKLVLGSKQFIDNFEEQLVGAKKDDKLDVNVTFPKEYHAKDLAGKKALFKVTVKEVYSPTIPKFDDALAKQLKFKDVAELKEKMLGNMDHIYGEAIYSFMKKHLLDNLENILDFDVPNDMFEAEKKNLEAHKAELEAEAKKDPKSKDSKEDKVDIEKLSLRRIRTGLFLAEYNNVNKITVTQDDVRAMVTKLIQQYPQQQNEILDMLNKDSKAIENFKGPILEDKAVKHILENVSVKEKAYSRKNLDKLLSEIY